MKKLPRSISNCKLEYMYDGSKNWLDQYIENYKKEKVRMEEEEEEKSVMINNEDVVHERDSPSSTFVEAKTSSTHSLGENLDDLSHESDEVLSDEFCGHTGCSFEYNVQESCLERPSFMMESVPYSTYVKLAPLFDMDPYKKVRTDDTNRCKLGPQEDEDRDVEEFIRLIEKEMGMRSDISEDECVEVGTNRKSTRDNEKLPCQKSKKKKYLKRTGAKARSTQVRNTLAKRSKEITQSIIRDFLNWYRSIGVEDEESTVDEAVLQDLFQIGFDSPTARAIALRIKEMPVVPESLAVIRNEPEFAVKKGLKKLVRMDIKLERQPAKLFAFGTMLSKEEPCLRFQPPRNDVKKTWTECERVPSELESLKIVWEGIENLRSTIAFSNWLKQHPDITPPGYLKEKGLLNINYEEWMEIYQGFEKEFDLEGAELKSRQKDSTGESSTLLQSRARSGMDQYSISSSYSLNWKA